MVPANWFLKLSNRLSTQWTFEIQNIRLGTGHYNVIIFFTWHWLSLMMHILKKKINKKQLDCSLNSIAVLHKELGNMSVLNKKILLHCISYKNSYVFFKKKIETENYKVK